jgi:thymidylate synthase (FAD)
LRHPGRLDTEVYKERLDAGVAREQARKDLPLFTYTEAYWKIDLWNLMHFLGLRMDLHAQAEIREYANTIGQKIVATWVPTVWEAFQDYDFQSVNLSRLEAVIVSRLLAGDLDGARQYAASFGWLETDAVSKQLRRSRERDEFLEKLRKHFSFAINWFDPSQRS